MESDTNISHVIIDVCYQLDIDTPRFTMADTLNDTQLANYNYKTDTLTIKKNYSVLYDAYFAIAHELRHKYQVVYNTYSFKDYKSTNTLSIHDYNMQPQEIDANAFAYLYMVSTFKVKPLFNGLDEDVKQAIIKKAKYILKSEYYVY